MVWFFSDNGGPPYNVAPTHNDPLRGNKGTIYEGGIRVPFVVQWRAGLPEGAVYEQPVISLDVLPTAAALAGAKLPDSMKLDGVNIAPHLKGEVKTPPHERLFWRTGGGASWAMREGHYKLVKAGKDAAPQLFDLNNDIGEAKDLVSERPDVVMRLQEAHDTWNAELIPPIFESPKPAARKAKQAGRKK